MDTVASEAGWLCSPSRKDLFMCCVVRGAAHHDDSRPSLVNNVFPKLSTTTQITMHLLCSSEKQHFTEVVHLPAVFDHLALSK